MTDPVPPYAYCSGCKKPSWNQRDIAYAKWKWGKYMCLACSPLTQKPDQVDQVSANHDVSKRVEPLYHRPQEEVQAELDFLQTHSIQDIPF